MSYKKIFETKMMEERESCINYLEDSLLGVISDIPSYEFKEKIGNRLTVLLVDPCELHVFFNSKYVKSINVHYNEEMFDYIFKEDQPSFTCYSRVDDQFAFELNSLYSTNPELSKKALSENVQYIMEFFFQNPKSKKD